MKKYIKEQLSFFAQSPFWRQWLVWLIFSLSLITNISIWLIYYLIIKHQIGSTPIYYSSGVFLLNTYLAFYVYGRRRFLSFLLLGIGLLIQIIIIVFLPMSIYFKGV